MEVEVSLETNANKPILDEGMIPVYYDETSNVWKKADSANKNYKYQWYDYNEKMWANSVTYDHTKAYNEGNTYEGKTFNGVDFVDAGYSNYDFNKESTFIVRFKGDNITKQTIVGNFEAGGVGIYLNNKKIYFELYAETAKAYKNIASITAIEEDVWYTVVGTYEGTTMKLYVNGELESSLNVTDTIKPSTEPILIGANPQPDGEHLNYYNGTISDAIVINDCLTGDEIAKYYSNNVNYHANSNLLFNKKFGNQETYLTNANYAEKGITFNGSTSYIDVGYSEYDFDKNLTIVSKFKTTGEESQHIISNAQAAGFMISIVENKINFSIYGETVQAYKTIISTTTVENDKWYTAVGTYDGTTMKLYVNGELEASLSLADSIKPSNVQVFIGANPNPKNAQEYFSGTISDALVTKEVITAEKIKNNYSNEINYQENDKTLFYYDLRNYENRELGEEIPMEMISTMQVWIPRYKYKVWNYNADGTVTSEPQEIEIVFEDGTSSTGEIECTDTISGTDGAKSESCKINNVECTDSTCNNKYYTHPAFTFGEEELEGFWIGKFELTGDIDNITTKPNLTSIRNQNVSSFSSNIIAMNDSNNQYGFNTSTDTHMIKNMEWGAVAYLSHSKYGVNREVYINNSSGYYTGRSGGNVGGSTPINGTYTDQTSATQYNTYGFYTYDGYLLEYGTNTKSDTKDISKVSSTTGNIYGVYDMSGGAAEYVMGNIVSPDGTTMMSGNSSSSNSGYTGIIYNSGSYTSYTGTYTYPDTKYYDKYSYGRSTSQRIRSKLGDGIKEVLNTSSRGWYSDYSFLAYSYDPWFNRSGYYVNGSDAGAFSSYYSSGSAYAYYSSRLVITP